MLEEYKIKLKEYMLKNHNDYYIEENEKFLGYKESIDNQYFKIYISKNKNDEVYFKYRNNSNDKTLKTIKLENKEKNIEELIDLCEQDNPIVKTIEYSNNTNKKVKKNSYSNVREKKFLEMINIPNNVNYNCKEFFYSLTENTNRKSNASTEIISLTNNKGNYIIDSSFERKLLKEIDEFECVESIKTQSLEIPYKKHKNSKIEKHYQPDIQILLKDGRLIIVEVKRLDFMVKDNVVNDYNVLKEYCEEYGYCYLMIDKKYVTFDMIKNYKISKDVEKRIIDIIKNKKSISLTDLEKLRKKLRIGKKYLYAIILKNKKLEFKQLSVNYKL